MFEVEKIRVDFPILKRKINGCNLVYLDSGATSQKPESVLRAMDDYYRNNNANIHRGVYDLSVESTKMVDEAREKVAEFIGGRSEEIVFTRNASESLNLVMYSWGKENVKEGDAVLVTKLEHHSNFVPWQVLCKETGAEFRVIGVDTNGRLDPTSLDYELRGASGKIKIFALTGASNAIGTLVDVNAVVKKVKEKNPEVVVVLDASQMVPHMKVDVSNLMVDFVAFSGHKMLGPTGIGVLWGKKELLNKMDPFLYGGDMIGEVGLESTTWTDLPNKFEAGTPDIAGIVGLGAAVDYLTSLGMDNVRGHEKELTEYALEKFEQLEKEGLVELYGVRNATERGGIITFNVKGIHAHDAAQVLNSFGICVRSGQHCAAPLVTSFGVMAMVRATFYVYNTKSEIDYLVEKIKEVPKVFV